jgi:hypothetical protein
MRWNRGDDDALQILESQVRKVRIGKGENTEEITEYRFKDPRELALKTMQEIKVDWKPLTHTIGLSAVVDPVS